VLLTPRDRPSTACRNSILASTFIGGFAFVQAADALQRVSDERGVVASDSLGPQQLRDLLLALLLFLAFLNFALTVRSAVHVGYLLGSATGQLTAVDFPEARRTDLDKPVQPILPAPEPFASALSTVQVSTLAAREQAAAREALAGVAKGAPLPSPATSAAPATASPALADMSREPNGHFGVHHRRPSAVDIEMGQGPNGCAVSRRVLDDSIVGGPSPGIALTVPEVVSPSADFPMRRLSQREAQEIRRQVTAKVAPPLQALEAADILQYCERSMRTLTTHFSLGFRAFYCALPLAVYGAGPIPFIAASVFTLFWLLYIDLGGCTAGS
jgi:uncharacterized membrane protein